MKLSQIGMLLILLMLSGACSDNSSQLDPDASPDSGDEITVRILPLGDSLTLGYGSAEEGSGSEGGYRLHLSQLLSDDGIDFDFVGSQQNGPEALKDRDHEGHNGYAVAQVAQLADAALETYEPHMVLLMAGTNDQITMVPPSQPPVDAAKDLKSLLLQIEAGLPGVQIIVAQLIPLSSNDTGITEYNALLPDIVDNLSGQGVNVRLVNMYAMGEENLSYDGIHPTNEGYDLIADIWHPALMDAIEDL